MNLRRRNKRRKAGEFMHLGGVGERRSRVMTSRIQVTSIAFHPVLLTTIVFLLETENNRVGSRRYSLPDSF